MACSDEKANFGSLKMPVTPPSAPFPILIACAVISSAG
jgi:hypothetical protein